MEDAREKSPQNKSDIETIPAWSYSGGLKYTAIAQILKRIPAGKVTTEKALASYLKKYYALEDIDINYHEFPLAVLREEDIPFQRYLSATGLLDRYYKDKAEGHISEEQKSGKFRVVDYKETMVDLDKIEIPTMNEAIGPCGKSYENCKKKCLN